MVFSSSLFLLYFLPAFLILYFLIPGRFKNIFALTASVLFYAWGAPDFIFIVLFSIIVDFYVVAWLSRSSGKKKKYLLALSVAINIGLLLYFKYANFFVENVNALLVSSGGNGVKWVEVLLPIGISFFTFQKMTYSVDVYRGVYHPLKKITFYKRFQQYFSYCL